MKMKLLLLCMFSVLLVACEADGLEAPTHLLSDNLVKIKIVEGKLEIHTETELIIFDENRDEIIKRGNSYKIMKLNKDGEDVAYILQVPKEEYVKFEQHYKENTK